MLPTPAPDNPPCPACHSTRTIPYTFRPPTPGKTGAEADRQGILCLNCRIAR